MKIATGISVLEAARQRIAYAFDNFDRVYVSFSGGKDSTVMTHLVAEEASRRGVRFGLLIIDLEAQYRATVEHVRAMVDLYAGRADVYWVCLPMLLRNAVTQFEPRWCCWDPDARSQWVREIPDHPAVVSDPARFPFFEPRMEFEEFMVLFGVWYAGEGTAAACVGIRADESLNRFRTIASSKKAMHGGARFTTLVEPGLYNVYPLYDWRVGDLWLWHHRTGKPHNRVYDLMHQAGLTPAQMRLCQPYGDDQRRGLWLFHLLEPETWSRVVARVNGANSGALYVQETGNVTGYAAIARPPGHTWKSFCDLLLSSLPAPTRAHYVSRFRDFIGWWKVRGYVAGVPDEAPKTLENAKLAPSYRRLCKTLLRNDWWCKGLGFSQPKSAAYGRFMDMKKGRADE